MATFQKFNQFVTDVAHGLHDFSSDQLKYALTNVAPVAATDSRLDDITEIAYTNLVENRNITTATSANNAGVHEIDLTDTTATAQTGALPTFRYVVIYNDDEASTANKELIGFVDYGSALDLAVGESLDIDFADPSITIT